MLRGKPHGLVHEIGVAGMKAGRDIGRAYQGNQMVVARIADTPSAIGLTHVAIDVDDLLHETTLMPPSHAR
jgi:hypothetical protein